MDGGLDEEYAVTVATYGRRLTLRSEVFLNYPLYNEEDGPIGMDYFVWIVHNSHRTVLVDTGFSVQGGSRRSRDLLIKPPELFARVGVDPASGPTVVITHAHYDHIGNLDLFPTSEVWVTRNEVDFWLGPHRNQPLFHHSVDEDALDHLAEVVKSGRAQLVSGRTWIAPGIEMIEVGGHTPGQAMVRVRTAAGWVLIASDAVHYYEEYERSMPFSSVADLVGMLDGFDAIRAMVASGEVQHLVAGHDPATLERLEAAIDGDGLIGTIGEVA